MPDLPLRVRESDQPIRFYFDESALGLGQAVAVARDDSIYPGHARSPIRPGTLDSDWVPVVAGNNWVVVLRDKRLDRRPAEIAALAANPVRALVLNRAGQLTVWNQLRQLARWWDSVEEQVSEPAPWIATVNSRGVTVKPYPGP